MIKTLKYVGAVLLACLLFSCGGNSSDGNSGKEITATLSVSPLSLNIPADGGESDFSITSNQSWSVHSNQSFITITPSSGSGSGKITVTVAENKSTQKREALLTISSSGKKASITVSQEAAAAKYADNESVVYQKSSKNKPFVIVFTGDGYTEDMFVKGSGKFDKDLDQAIEHLFSIEPYKTYKDYFTIYKIAAYSKEAGVSIKRPVRKYKDTRFKCMWENIDEGGSSSTLIEGDMDAVKEVWSKVPGLSSDAAQTYAPICIIINEKIRAGTVEVLPKNLLGAKFGGLDIKTVSMIPLGNEKQSFESLIQHELGGHGIGMLSDEYAFSSMGEIPDVIKQKLIDLQLYGALGFGWNLTFVSDGSSSPWSQFLAIQKYKDQGIGMFEGGMNYAKGVWRSSWDSCMKNNKPYFNVQSRWLIYKRIKTTVGESYSLADFLANDNETKFELPSSTTESPAKEVSYSELRGHVSF